MGAPIRRELIEIRGKIERAKSEVLREAHGSHDTRNNSRRSRATAQPVTSHALAQGLQEHHTSLHRDHIPLELLTSSVPTCAGGSGFLLVGCLDVKPEQGSHGQGNDDYAGTGNAIERPVGEYLAEAVLDQHDPQPTSDVEDQKECAERIVRDQPAAHWCATSHWRRTSRFPRRHSGPAVSQ
jgi:hypothetical protein